jgi:hypothetical protein
VRHDRRPRPCRRDRESPSTASPRQHGHDAAVRGDRIRAEDQPVRRGSTSGIGNMARCPYIAWQATCCGSWSTDVPRSGCEASAARGWVMRAR